MLLLHTSSYSKRQTNEWILPFFSTTDNWEKSTDSAEFCQAGHFPKEGAKATVHDHWHGGTDHKNKNILT